MNNLQLNNACLEVCYEKYLYALRDVSFALKDIGYKSHSPLAYKCFPEENPHYIAYN